MKSHGGMKCWASILTLTFRTARMAQLSAIRASHTLPTQKVTGTHFCYRLSGPQGYWMRKERNRSLGNFQGPYRESDPEPPPSGAAHRLTAHRSPPHQQTVLLSMHLRFIKKLQFVLPGQCMEVKPLHHWGLKTTTHKEISANFHSSTVHLDIIKVHDDVCYPSIY